MRGLVLRGAPNGGGLRRECRISANFGLRIRNSTNDRSGAITPLVEIAAITSDGSMQTLLGRQPRIPSASTKSSRSAVWRIQGKGDLHLCSGSAVWRE
jgi:hypothetical protein